MGHFPLAQLIDHAEKMKQHDIFSRNGHIGLKFRPPVAVRQLLAEKEIPGSFNGLVKWTLRISNHFFPDSGRKMMDFAKDFIDSRRITSRLIIERSKRT